MLEREVSLLRAQCGSGCCGESSAMGECCLTPTTKHFGKVWGCSFCLYCTHQITSVFAQKIELVKYNDTIQYWRLGIWRQRHEELQEKFSKQESLVSRRKNRYYRKKSIRKKMFMQWLKRQRQNTDTGWQLFFSLLHSLGLKGVEKPLLLGKNGVHYSGDAAIIIWGDWNG